MYDLFFSTEDQNDLAAILKTIYAKYCKKSRLACDDLGSIRGRVWGYWNQSTLCIERILPCCTWLGHHPCKRIGYFVHYLLDQIGQENYLKIYDL